MKITLNIDDRLLEKCRQLTGITEKTTLVREGLVAPFKEKIVTGGGYYYLAQSEKARTRNECLAFGEWIGSRSY